MSESEPTDYAGYMEVDSAVTEPPGAEEETAHGAEPDVIDAADKHNSLQENLQDDIETYGGYEERPIWTTTPDYRKAILSGLIWVIVATSAIVVIIAFGGDPFCYEENDATLTRRMQMMSWMNPTISPGSNFYNYTCGRYNMEYTDESIFSQTQNLLIGFLGQQAPFVVSQIASNYNNAFKINPNITDFTMAGLFGGCIQLEVDADYRQPTRPALYIYTPCDGSCYPQRHRADPVHISSQAQIPQNAPTGTKDFLTTAFHRNVAVYWFPPNSNETNLISWYGQHCQGPNVDTPASMWNGIIQNTSPYNMAFTYYGTALTTAAINSGVFMVQASHDMDTVIQTLVMAVKKYMIEYIDRGASFTGQSPELKNIFKQRVASLNVHYGSGETIIPTCGLDIDLYDCLVDRWNHQLYLVDNVDPILNISSQWPMSGFMVNAEFNPINNNIYIPYAIASPPMYNPEWPQEYQLATLGGIIAHEMGHGIYPGWNFVVNQNMDSLDEFESCLIRNFNASGSERPVRTLSEAIADFISLQTIIRPFREQSVKATQLGFILWNQIWCMAGQPWHYPQSYTDPHPADPLRTDATVRGMIPFYAAFGLPIPNADVIC